MSETSHQYLIRSLRRVVGPGGERGPCSRELLDRYVRQGDRAAFEVLVWRHAALIFGVCLRVLGQVADAEDAFQATVLVFLKKAHTIGPRASLASWLYRVTYRLALRERRTRNRRERREGLVRRVNSEPDSPSDPGLGAVLAEELAALPEKYRAPLLLYHFEGMTRQETARALGCPPGTVASRIGRGQVRLRGRLSRRGVALPAAGLGGMIARDLSAAVPPAELVQAVVRVQAAVAAGAAWTATGAPPAAVGMARGFVQQTWWCVAVTITLVASGLIGSGAGGYCFSRDQQANPASDSSLQNPGGLQVRFTNASGSVWAVSPQEVVRNLSEQRKVNRGAGPKAATPPPVTSALNAQSLADEPNSGPDENPPPRITAYFERADGAKITATFRHRGAVLDTVTLPVAAGAAITRNDKPLRLADLEPGWLLRVMLSKDESEVVAIRVRDRDLPALRGTLKSLDHDRRMTITARTGGADQDRTLSLARTVDVEINNWPATAADLKPGMAVWLQLTPDGTAVMEIASRKTTR